MKIIFMGHDGDIEELVRSLGEGVEFYQDQEEVLEALEDIEDDDSCLLFLDYDQNRKELEKFNKSIFKNEWITRIIISSELNLKDFKKHQKGKTAAHGYVRKPFTKKILQSILDDLNISQVIEENEIFEEGQELPNIAGLVSEVESSDTTDEDESFEEVSNIQEFDPQEFRVVTEVRSLIDLHSIEGEKPPYEGEINDRIQAKFNMVFGESEDFDDDDDHVSLDSDEELVRQDLREEKTSESISLDLDDEVASDKDDPLEISLDEEEEGDDELNLSIDDSIEDNEEIDLNDDAFSADVDEDDELDFSIDDETEEDDAVSEDEAENNEELEFSTDEEEEEATKEDDNEDVSLNFDLSDALEEESSQDALEDIEPLEAQNEEDISRELDELTQNRKLPTPEELSEFEEQTGDIEIPEELMAAQEDTPTPEETPVHEEEEVMTDDENEDILEFDDGQEESAESDGELSFSTGEKSEDKSSEDEDEGGLDFDLGAIDEDEAVLEEGTDGGFALDEGTDDSFALDTDSDEEDEIIEDDGAEVEGVADLGALEEELEEVVSLPDDSDLEEPTLEESEFEEDELAFSDDEDEELEKTQAINLDEVKKQHSAAMSEESADSETDDEFSLDDTGSFAIPDESDDEDEVELIEDALDDGFEEDTNPTMVMSDDVKQDLEDMIDEPTSTEEFRPEGMQEETGLMDSDDILDDENFSEDSESFDEPEEAPPIEAPISESVERPREEVQAKATVDHNEVSLTQENERIPPRFHEGEALRLQATIRQLREERESFLNEIQELKKEKRVIEQDNLGLKAELEEAKIEIAISKKRHTNEVDEMRYRLRLTDEKKLYAEEKVKTLQKEFDRLQSKVRVDFNHIKQREKELEGQLELAKMDSESQVKSRDKKILDLKRKIDQLEFNMENIVIREQKSRDDKVKLEERLERIMKTLRGSIEVLEEDRE